MEIGVFVNLAKVDLLGCHHALKKCGLFENVERMKMAVHSFDLGDIVTIFQMSPGKGLMIEGPAAIVEIVDDVDEQYVVRFRNELDETYERFVGKGLQAGRGP